MTTPLDRSVVVGLSPRDQELFWRFGAGARAQPPFSLLHEGFQAQAALRPCAVAVTCDGISLTYADLDRQASRLACLLIEHGIQPGDRVGLFLCRSIPMVVGILAILKAGAAYVPQDVRITPDDHIRHIADTAATSVILTLSRFAGALSPLGRTIIAIDAVSDSRPVEMVPMSARPPSDPAVVIFTSGTTGRPNGVAVTHANLCNVIAHGPGALGVRPGMRVAQLLNIAFDMAVWEIFVALSHGAELVIRGDDIGATVREVDVVIATPSVLARVDPARCLRVQVVALAGERCPRALAEAWSFARFHNACGPTEVTIVNTVQAYRRGGSLTIGRPLPNTTVYVLDEHLRPCPIGVVGEMWAGGACVSAGYVGNDVLTAERYRPDPFLGGDHRMFRTRDLGRWTEDGELEHHGRTDDQVKVRGFRVELDAVTSALECVPGCKRAATILYDGDLIGFMEPAEIDVEFARRALADILPYYCVPTSLVGVGALPHTSRGKIDKRALAAMLETAMIGGAA